MAKKLILLIITVISATVVQTKNIDGKKLEEHALRTNEVIFPDIDNADGPKQISLIPIGSTVNRITNFLNSPLVQAILTNETIQAVLRDERVQGVLKNPIVQSMLRDPIIQDIINSPQTKGITMLQSIFANLAKNADTMPTAPIRASPRLPQFGYAIGGQPPAFVQSSQPMMATILRGLDGVLGILQAYMSNQNMVNTPIWRRT